MITTWELVEIRWECFTENGHSEGTRILRGKRMGHLKRPFQKHRFISEDEVKLHHKDLQSSCDCPVFLVRTLFIMIFLSLNNYQKCMINFVADGAIIYRKLSLSPEKSLPV
jgi:hypothetical protein